MISIAPNAAYVTLACVYAAIAFACLAQLVRAQLRQPRCTTQKLFHAAVCACAAMRAGTFGAHHTLTRASAVARLLAMDLPSLVFCSAFGALAWFWSDVYHNAKRERRAGRRTFIIYIIANIAMYVFLCAVVAALARGKISDVAAMRASRRATALASSYVASMFTMYGTLLIIMLRRFPNESEGRVRKMWEVAVVASASFGACVTRAVRDAADANRASGVQSAYDLTNASALRHVIYYSSTEIIATICVLYVLRKLPPARGAYDEDDDEDDIEQPFAADFDDGDGDGDSDSSD